MALAEGNRESFIELVKQRHNVKDYQLLLQYFSQNLGHLPLGQGGFNCPPKSIDNNKFATIKPLKKFQQQFNLNRKALNSASPELKVDGDIGPVTWGAIFDVMEFALLQELGTSAESLQEMRQELKWVDENIKSLGFGERYPVDKLKRDNTAMKENRRVEILFFDSGEEPDLALAKSDPDITELYLPTFYQWQSISCAQQQLSKTLKVRLLDPQGECIAHAPYEIYSQGNIITSGEADENGFIVEEELEMEDIFELHWGDPKEAQEFLPLALCYQQTIDRRVSHALDEEAFLTRLSHLGYARGSLAEDSISHFQRDYKIEDHGKLDENTRAKILALHDQQQSRSEVNAA